MVNSARKRPSTQIAGNNSHHTGHDSMSTGVGSALEAGALSHTLVPEYESTLTSTTKKTRSGRKKKDKRSKKLKEDGSGGNGNNSSLSKDGSSLETTATPEGKQMAQVLSTFSRLEQSRFEAFRKASFPGDAIAKFVAHCLIHEQHRPLSGSSDTSGVGSELGVGIGSEIGTNNSGNKRMAVTTTSTTDTNNIPDNNNSKNNNGNTIPDYNNSTNNNSNTSINTNTNTNSILRNNNGNNSRHPPSTTAVQKTSRLRYLRPVGGAIRRPVLSEVVAPGQAGDITVVVSTLAKEYAQRLVQEARKHATERRRRQQQRRKQREQRQQQQSQPSNQDSDDDEDDDDDDDYQDDDDDDEDEDPAISPEDILKAYAHREARGLDPGFFLQAPMNLNCRRAKGGGPVTNVSLVLADPDTHRRQDLARSVVLAAQKAYDKEQKQQEKEERERESAAAAREGKFENDDNNNETEDDDDDDDIAMEMEMEMTMETNNGDSGKGNKGDDNYETHPAVETWDQTQEEENEGEDTSEKAVRLFAKHVNRMIARQHGITVVTSNSDDDEHEHENEQEIEETKKK